MHTRGRPSHLLGAVVAVLLAGCGVAKLDSTPASTTALANLQPDITVVQTTVASSTTAAARPLVYVFPFTGQVVSYQHEHHDYPATDVFGCGANVVAPLWGTVVQTRLEDLWDPKVDDPATRGGLYVAMVGGDNVRYYFAHLASVSVAPGDAVDAGTPLGIMGQTGNARKTACHTHFGISRPCPSDEWAVRRGEVWPWTFLDAWRSGNTTSSPALAIYAIAQQNPQACEFAQNAPSAGDA